jgi:hypothetical protein
MRIFDAVWAFGYKGPVPGKLQHALSGNTLSTYGWLWLIVGIVLVVCGAGVLARNKLSRWVGMVAGALGRDKRLSGGCRTIRSGRSPNIVLGVAVVFALATHGQREAAA